MNIDTLRLYAEIARSGSFSKAAEVCGVTQSRVSQAIREMELDLGVKLVDRTHRPWALTVQGEIFYKGCCDLIGRYDSLRKQVGFQSLESFRQIRVGAIYSVGIRHMRIYIRNFARPAEKLRVSLEYLHPDEVIERVLSGDIDVGIISFPRPQKNLRIVHWQDELMVLACYPDHPLAGEEEVDVSRISGENMVTFDKGLQIRREIDRFLRDRNVHVTAELAFDNIESIKRAVEARAGVAILPRPTFEREVRQGLLSAVHFKAEDFCRPLAILTRKMKECPEDVKRFVDFLCRGKVADAGVQEGVKKQAGFIK